MKQKILLSALALTLLGTVVLGTACSAAATTPPEPDPTLASAVHPVQHVEPPVLPEAEAPAAQNPVEGLVRDEYDGLEITASVLERKAILPGFGVPVSVTVKNTGDKTISYVQGSGSHTTPSALVVEVDGLQTARYKDHLGAATMDFVTKDLKPGEAVSFVAYVMTIEPHPDFSKYTDELFGDGQQYIAEADWSALQERFGELKAAGNGVYDGRAYLRYSIQEDGGGLTLTQEPTGFSQGDFTINIAG